jgi:hypothetical protein
MTTYSPGDWMVLVFALIVLGFPIIAMVIDLP